MVEEFRSEVLLRRVWGEREGFGFGARGQGSIIETSCSPNSVSIRGGRGEGSSSLEVGGDDGEGGGGGETELEAEGCSTSDGETGLACFSSLALALIQASSEGGKEDVRFLVSEDQCEVLSNFSNSSNVPTNDKRYTKVLPPLSSLEEQLLLKIRVHHPLPLSARRLISLSLSTLSSYSLMISLA